MPDINTVVVTPQVSVVAVNSSVPGSYDSVARLGLRWQDVTDPTYGATGDGVTDDTAAINAAITACNAAGGGVVYFPPGTYMVNADYNGGYGIRMKSGVSLVGTQGTTVKAIANSLTHYGVITALGPQGSPITDIAIRNLRVMGERDSHSGSTGEFGHCIQLYGVLRATIENCVTTKGWGDGIYLGSPYSSTEPCQDIFITNCYSVDNRRNNISVVGCLRGSIIGCGLGRADGTAPKAGIDLEPDATGNVEDVTVEGCSVFDNEGYGILVVGSATGCRIINNSVRGTGASSAGYSIAVGGIDTLVADNVISEVTHGSRGAIDVGSTAVRAVIANNILRDIEAGANRPGIYVHASATDVQVRGNHITKCNSLVATGGTGVINVASPKTQVCGNFIRDSLDLGIAVGSGAPDCHIVDNIIDSVVSRGIYVDSTRPVIIGNTIRDVSSVTNGMVQLTANATASTLIGNKAVLTTPNTAIVPFYILAAPSVMFGNSGTGTKAHKGDYVPVQVSADRGDASVTLTPDVDEQEQRFDTTLTQNRTVTLSTTRAYAGCRFRVVRTGLGAFTLNVGGLKTIPSGTAAFVEVTYNGSAWVLSGYGTL